MLVGVLAGGDWEGGRAEEVRVGCHGVRGRMLGGSKHRPFLGSSSLGGFVDEA